MRDGNRETYARKAMHLCDFAFGSWSVGMLNVNLQEIIKIYPDHFNGTLE